MNKVYLNAIIITGILGILTAGGLIYYEYFRAKDFCSSDSGFYSLKFENLEFSHFCNNKSIINTINGWQYDNSLETFFQNKILNEYGFKKP